MLGQKFDPVASFEMANFSQPEQASIINASFGSPCRCHPGSVCKRTVIIIVILTSIIIIHNDDVYGVGISTYAAACGTRFRFIVI